MLLPAALLLLAAGTSSEVNRYYKLRTNSNSDIMVPEDFILSAGTGNFESDKQLAAKTLMENQHLESKCTIGQTGSVAKMQDCVHRTELFEHMLPEQRKRYYSTSPFRFKDLIKRKEGKKDQYDCIFSERMVSKPVPGQCYTPDFVLNEDDHKFFFKEIMNDLRYTFDFVLHDEFDASSKESQFWYLILYLKQLVLVAPDPVSLVNLAAEDNYRSQFGKFFGNMIKYTPLMIIFKFLGFLG